MEVNGYKIEPGAKLSKANLRGAKLRGADLSGADLSGADLSGADLSGADLTDANLSYATMGGANLEGASLTDANLKGANFKGVHLEDSDLQRFRYGREKFWDKYVDLFENLNYPPMFIHGHGDVAHDYFLELKDAYIAGLALPDIDFITDDAKPFEEFETKFSKQIQEAKKYRTATNDDYVLALDLYGQENGKLH